MCSSYSTPSSVKVSYSFLITEKVRVMKVCYSFLITEKVRVMKVSYSFLITEKVRVTKVSYSFLITEKVRVTILYEECSACQGTSQVLRLCTVLMYCAYVLSLCTKPEIPWCVNTFTHFNHVPCCESLSATLETCLQYH
jgi:hypothetical protein